MQETIKNIFGSEEEFVNPTLGPFTKDDLKISEDDVKGFIKRNKDAPKGLVNQMLFGMMNPKYTMYGEQRPILPFVQPMKSSAEFLKDRLIAEALTIDAQKKASKKAAEAPAELGLMSPKNVMESVNNTLNRSGILMPVGMDAAKAPAVPVDKPTDPRTLTGEFTLADRFKSFLPGITKGRTDIGQILSANPALELVTTGPGGATLASGMRINLKGLANLGEEYLTQSLLAKIKKGSTTIGNQMLDAYLDYKKVDQKKLPQNNQVIKQLGNNPKNVPVLKVKDLNVEEDLQDLDVIATPEVSVDTGGSVIARYTGSYREGKGYNADVEARRRKAFKITDSETGTGLYAKGVKTPYEKYRKYKHSEVVGEQYATKPIYGHNRTIALRKLEDTDIHPNINNEADALGLSNEFLHDSYNYGDFDFYEKRGFWNLKKEDFDIDEKNMITKIEPADVDSFTKKHNAEKLLMMKIRLQRMNALVNYIDIPKIEVLQKPVPYTPPKVAAALTDTAGEKIAALSKDSFYTFDDVLNKIKSEKNLDKMVELENYIVSYARHSIHNSLSVSANALSDGAIGQKTLPLNQIWLRSIRTNLGYNPGDYFYSRKNDVNEGIIKGKFNTPIIQDYPHFKNPLSYELISEITEKIAEIFAQKNAIDTPGVSINLQQAKEDRLNIPHMYKKHENNLNEPISYREAIDTLKKHKDAGGQELYALYKRAIIESKLKPVEYNDAGNVIKQGTYSPSGDLKNKIQTAEKNWGKGTNILRFAEEQYDTFKPSKSGGFDSAEDMLTAMGKKGGIPDFELDAYLDYFNVPDVAFAYFKDKPEHLLELTTLHNIKKAIEDGYDVVQFNSFNTQAHLSMWTQHAFKGKPDDMKKYYMSGFQGKEVSASDKALMEILYNNTKEHMAENKYLKGLFRDVKKLPTNRMTDNPGYITNYIKEVKKAIDEKDIDRKVLTALENAPTRSIENVFDTIYTEFWGWHRLKMNMPTTTTDKVKQLQEALNQAQAFKRNAYGTPAIPINLKKKIIKLFFSPEIANVSTKKQGIIKKLITSKDKQELNTKERNFDLLLIHTKQKILFDDFNINMKITPGDEYAINAHNVFYNKYDAFPTEEGLTAALRNIKGDRTTKDSSSKYGMFYKQYDKDKKKILEKLGFKVKEVKDNDKQGIGRREGTSRGRPTHVFYEIDLGKTKKEKLDLLERLNNYEVKLYSRVNPVPTFNEVVEEELTTEAENKTAVPAFM